MTRRVDFEPEWTPARFVAAVSAGAPDFFAWLRARTERRAAPQFSPWAWGWARDDFNAELSLQLLVTVRRADFELRSSVEAYVDTCIMNLCRTWFRRIGRVRAGLPLDDLPAEAVLQAPDVFEHVALALDLRRALLELDAGCRDLLVGKYVTGWSLQDLGERAGVSGATIQSRLHACRERLRTIFTALGRGARKTRSGALPGLRARKGK